MIKGRAPPGQAARVLASLRAAAPVPMRISFSFAAQQGKDGDVPRTELAPPAITPADLEDLRARLHGYREVVLPPGFGWERGTDGAYLKRAARLSGNRFMILATESVATLRRSDGFTNLETRRGMDDHRRRPQSVEHSSPRREAVVQSEVVTTFSHLLKRLSPRRMLIRCTPSSSRVWRRHALRCVRFGGRCRS
jgi:hypothetical protein